MKEARMKTAKRSDEWAVCLSLLSSLRSFPSPIHLIRRSRAPAGRNEMDDVRRRGVAWRAAIMSEPREGGGYRRQQRPRDRRRSSSPYIRVSLGAVTRSRFPSLAFGTDPWETRDATPGSLRSPFLRSLPAAFAPRRNRPAASPFGRLAPSPVPTLATRPPTPFGRDRCAA